MRTEAESRITRRGYLILRAMQEAGCGYPLASEAVASVAIEHPEWDMEQKKTWSEWEETE
jgi:hypothetical protein